MKDKPADPDDVLLDVLAEKAVVGMCSRDLPRAVEPALQDIDPGESDGVVCPGFGVYVWYPIGYHTFR